ncbi:MAG: hypothetical protein FJ253_03130 [Phycisphaerae bacterium]|nr:hypothetical protein [Phycisphaerae bacterium]
MNTEQILDSYVHDVARKLPRGKRNDIAFELRSLLSDELAARSRSEGRQPDRAMVMSLLNGFGSPTVAASRYHPLPAVIEPADTHHFLLWTIGGSIAISLLSVLGPTKRVEGAPYFQWLGILVIVFAFIGLWRRANPGVMRWKPSRGLDWMPRPLALLALVATIVFPFFMYLAPQTFVRVMFFGAIPDHGVELTEPFRTSPLRLATISVLSALVVLYAIVLVKGRWQSWINWSFAAAHASLGVLCLGHAAAIEPRDGASMIAMFEYADANKVAAPIFALTGALLILCALYEGYRETTRIRPSPARVDG